MGRASLLFAFAAAAQLGAAVRMTSLDGTAQLDASAAAANSKYDIVVCDHLCMQCTEGMDRGRNILIQRQKTGVGAVTTAALGALTVGLGLVPVAQIAGCPMVGFESWEDRVKDEEQPFATSAWMGVFNVKPGLDKLVEVSSAKKDALDTQALAACKELASPYLWQAIKSMNFSGSVHDSQEDVVRRCLTHSALCGHESAGDLQSHRWAYHPGVEQCSPPLGDERRLKRTQSWVSDADVKSVVAAAMESGKDCDDSSDVDLYFMSGGDDIEGIGTHHVRRYADDDPETIKAVGGALEDAIVAKLGKSGGPMLNDREIGDIAGTSCYSEEQAQRCIKDGDSADTCTGRCCVNVCKYFSHDNDKCLCRCVKGG